MPRRRCAACDPATLTRWQLSVRLTVPAAAQIRDEARRTRDAAKRKQDEVSRIVSGAKVKAESAKTAQLDADREEVSKKARHVSR